MATVENLWPISHC